MDQGTEGKAVFKAAISKQTKKETNKEDERSKRHC